VDFGNTDFLNPFFLLGNVRPKRLKPRFSFASVAEIDLNALEAAGVRAFIFDVDNTLCRHHGARVDERVKNNFIKITTKHPSCILSNAGPARIRSLHGHFGVHVVSSIEKKPKAGAFKAALAYLKAKPGETAVVGDRLLTDVSGANKMGCVSVRVRPLHPESEPAFLRLARFLEDALHSLYSFLGL
jgi:HAD superfamily phosphatase (TIGR01668 family)